MEQVNEKTILMLEVPDREGPYQGEIERSIVPATIRELRYANPHLPILQNPKRSDAIAVSNTTLVTYQLPFKCEFFIVQNIGTNPFMFGNGGMETVSGVAGTVTKGGYGLGAGAVSFPIFGLGINSIDFLGLTGTGVATILLF